MAKKSAPKKVVAKKEASKKAAVKKAALSKGTTKKVASKKSATKKASTKKTAIQKTTSNKGAVAKKAALSKSAAQTALKANAKVKAKAEVSKGLKQKGSKGSNKVEVAQAAQVQAKSQGRGSARTHARPSVDLCREVACDSTATSSGYCRLHYIKNWKKIKRKEIILREKKLNQYIEELVAKYPDKYIEAIRQDLSDEKAFSKVIYDLELEEDIDNIDVDGDSDESIIESIGKHGTGFDDDGDF